jgi:nucleotide-binding universal stress UspA family protein
MNSASDPADIPLFDEGPHLATSEIRFTRILVATDFSKPAELALKTAIAISELFDSKIFIVHATSPFVYGTGTEALPLEVYNVNLDAAIEKMHQIVEGEPALGKREPKTIVAYAGAVELIEQVTHDENIDLIVVGSHGASGIERLALGSVAETILRRATCPVLIVGPHSKAELHPFRSIVFASDLETTGLRGAQYAAALAESVHGKLTLLHVLKESASQPDTTAEVAEDHAMHELQRLLPPDIDRYCKATVRVEYGSPAEAIAGVALSESASLIVVGLRDRVLADHTPWSTLSHVIREVTCPVLGVRGHLV